MSNFFLSLLGFSAALAGVILAVLSFLVCLQTVAIFYHTIVAYFFSEMSFYELVFFETYEFWEQDLGIDTELSFVALIGTSVTMIFIVRILAKIAGAISDLTKRL